MPFLRLTRDSRGYENTFLLHVAHPGEEPRVLYWYRSAPGVRVGRSALDEDAIRSIEDRHPEIEFDWPHIIEVGATLVPEVDAPPPRPRRRTPRPAEEAAAASPLPSPAAPAPAAAVPSQTDNESTDAPADEPPVLPPSRLLDELVGREIAARLRDRYADIAARVRSLGDRADRPVLQARADALNPDGWMTPDAVLRGVEHAERLFDELRRELP